MPVAVAAFTNESAYLNHDDEAGTIQPGRRADLTVLDCNIFDLINGTPADAPRHPHNLQYPCGHE